MQFLVGILLSILILYGIHGPGYGQTISEIGQLRHKLSVPTDSIVIHVPNGIDLMVSTEVNELLAQQSMRWLAEIDSIDRASQAKVAALKDSLLSAQDQGGQALSQEVAVLRVQVDSLAHGWDRAFTTSLEIITSQDSLLNVYALQINAYANIITDLEARLAEIE